MSLQVRDVHVDLDRTPVLRGVDLEVRRGQLVGLLGPNGSGKSTLLRTIYRAHRPRRGHVHVDGEDVHRLRPRTVARRIAVVLQHEAAAFDYSVREMVMLGRGPHKGVFERDHDRDHELVTDALQRVGTEHLADRGFIDLSGGERQRVLIARALTQQAEYLLLDEPTNHLDVRYQLQILDLLREVGLTVLAVLHDLNLAAAFCDRIHVLDRGRIHDSGRVEEVLDAAMIRRRFGVEAAVVPHPLGGHRQVLFPGPARPAGVDMGDNGRARACD